MEELEPQELEELVQELEGESGAEESLSPEVQALLRDLQPSRRYTFRRRAARQLSEVSKSNLHIVTALVTAAETDASAEVRAAAAESLRAPVHQAVLQEDADLMRRAQHEAAARDWEAEMLASPGQPRRLRVEAQGSALNLSWKDGALHRVLSAGLTSLLLLVFGFSLFAGTLSRDGVCAMALALSLAGYWALVAFVNSTQITVSREEWIFQRGPFPFPSRRFYSLGRTRIDPAAYREIRAAPVEDSRRGWGASDIWTIIARAAFGQSMASRTTFTLYARAKDGSDKLLLTGLEDHEAAYLTRALQKLLDVSDGEEEVAAKEGLRHEDIEEPLEELEEGSGADKSLSPEVDGLLHNLQSSRRLTRREAVQRLGDLHTSSFQIVQALVEAKESDSNHQVRVAAAESLQARVHQEVLRRHPDLMEVTESTQQQRPAAGMRRSRSTMTGGPSNLEESQKRKWVVGGNLAIVLAWAAGVYAGTYRVTGSFSWLPENLPRIVGAAATGMRYGFCCTLPVLAFGLFLLWMVGRGFIAGKLKRTNLVVAIIVGAIIAAVGGYLFGCFAVVEWYF